MPTLDGLVRGLAETDDQIARGRLVARGLDLFAPDTVFSALKDESERYWKIDPHTSVRLADALI
ncbi:MAG: hypothetical protein M3Q65_11330, partial [Chloroflexota bacterium]|nr:hypothetical protein [Chloroflexota bacterium]